MKINLYSMLAVTLAVALLGPVAALAQVPAANATVVLYRPFKLFGWGINYGIYHEGQELCRLSNRRYLVVTVPAGMVTLHSHIVGFGAIKKERIIKFPAQAGETYYVQTNPQYFPDVLNMAVVPASYAQTCLQRIPKPDHCSEPFSLEH